MLGSVAAALVGVLSCAGAVSAAEAVSRDFETAIKPILAQHCFHCHGPDKQKAKLRLDTLNPDLVNGPHAETWHDALNNLNLGDMPPEDEPPLVDADRRLLVGWLTGELKRAAAAKRQSGGLVTMRRLTRYEYNNTMRDLLGIDLDFAENLPPEPKSPDGFKNNGLSLGMSPIQMEYYLKAARSALAKAIVTGPAPEVVQHRAVKSERPRKAYSQSQNGELLPGDMFLVKTLKFPREGLVRVRVTAQGEAPDGLDHPRLRVSVGHRADVHSPELAFGEIDVLPGDGTRTFEFTGRIENFPLPGHNPKYPGLLIALTNEYDSGLDIKSLRKKIAAAQKAAAKRKKSKANGKPAPPAPKIELPPMSTITVKSVEFEGPIFDAWPPESHTSILFERPPSVSESDYARQVIKRFMDRAYRRPAAESEVDAVHGFYRSIRDATPTFEEAVRESLAMVLISPQFLYLVEPSSGKKGPQPLTDHELASRLSYFLWSTMPDASLRAAADSGALRSPGELEKQVRRMIADPRSHAFVEHFASQWLDLSGLERVAINPEYYPDFNNDLKRHMRGETLAFFAEVLRKDLSALTLIDSDFVMINAPLAKHYGLAGPKGMAFERVALKPSDRRGGLLTQASVLLVNSTGEDSHPIRRAVWVRDRLLDDPPAPPPPDVPELKTEDPNFAALPLKRQLELHREKASCNDCHAQIDPWGIPFEHYDAIGQWRDQVSRVVNRKKPPVKTPVVADATLPGGHKVSGIDGLKSYLSTEQRQRFAHALVRKLLTYSLGRTLTFSDGPQVEALVKEFEANDYRLGELMVAVVKSKSFSSK